VQQQTEKEKKKTKPKAKPLQILAQDQEGAGVLVVPSSGGAVLSTQISPSALSDTRAEPDPADMDKEQLLEMLQRKIEAYDKGMHESGAAARAQLSDGKKLTREKSGQIKVSSQTENEQQAVGEADAAQGRAMLECVQRMVIEMEEERRQEAEEASQASEGAAQVHQVVQTNSVAPKQSFEEILNDFAGQLEKQPWDLRMTKRFKSDVSK
jgi:hypothetical protein